MIANRRLGLVTVSVAVLAVFAGTLPVLASTTGKPATLARPASHQRLLAALEAPIEGGDARRFEAAARHAQKPRVTAQTFSNPVGASTQQRATAVACAAVCNTAIASGFANGLELRSGGTVWGWGYNGDGELGLGDFTARLFPTQVPGLTSVTTIAAGAYHSLALRSDQTAWAWGYNGDGELGNGSQNPNGLPNPVQVNGLSGVVGISGGLYHSLAVESNGSVWAWGDNSFGQLGTGATSTTPTLAPVRVTGLSGVVQVAAGAYFSLARKSDGSVWAWGDGLSGQLGNGGFVSSSTPVQVHGLSGASTVVAGDYHALALLPDGSLRAWGNNYYGQLGDGTGSDQPTPVRLSIAGVGGIAAGGEHSLAARVDGTVWNWGYNFAPTPAQVPNIASATAVATRDDLLVALGSDGSVWVWGLVTHATPVQVPGLPSTSGLLVAGGFHTFYLNPNGGFSGMYAWGSNGDGQLGNGTTIGSSLPVKVNTPINGFSAVSAGLFHNLAADHIGSNMYAWGDNLDGQLGDGTTTSRSTPILIAPGPQPVGFAAGGYHSVGCFTDYINRTTTGRAWGNNNYGQLGNGTTTSSPTPVSTLNNGCGQAAGHFDSFGGTQAWGYNGDGELGNGTTTTSSTPVQIQGLPALAPGTGYGLVTGGFHTFVLTYGNPAYVFGLNNSGQLGNGTRTNVTSAMANPAISPAAGRTGVGLLAAGGFHTLWLRADGTVSAFGANDFGQLGTARTDASANPTQVLGLSNVVDVAAGDLSSFAVTNDGRVWQWGANFESAPMLVVAAPGAPTSVHAIPGNTESTLTWTQPASDGGSAITSYVVAAAPAGPTALVSALAPAATIANMVNGSAYTFTVRAINGMGPGPPSSADGPVTPTTVAQGPQIAVLPAISDAAYGGYTTIAYLMNSGSSPASVMVRYFQPTGPPPPGAPPGNSITGLLPGATWTLRSDNDDALKFGQAAAALVYSDQPLSIFVNEFPPNNVGDGTSYTGIQLPKGAGSTLYAPAIASGAYGGYTTGIGLLNLGGDRQTVTITYRDGTGSVVTAQSLTVDPYTYQGVYSGNSGSATDANLPQGFAGTATITSSGGLPLAAVVNEVGPAGQFSSYDAVAGGSTTLQGPTTLNNVYGGFYTGIGIQNTTATAGSVTVTYYDPNGAATTKVFPINANGYLALYQGDPNQGPAPGAYTARLQSDVAIAAIVNEVAPKTPNGAQQSTAYNTFAGGPAVINLPLVESAGSDGWSTGLGIMNTGSAATTMTVTYFDAATGSPVGTAQSQLLQPNAFWGLYQPTGGLPNGSRASAQVRTSGGSVAVICNEANAISFMSYNGQ